VSPGERGLALGECLAVSAPLWRGMPFREARPVWCASYPDLTAQLLAIDDATLTALSGNPASAAEWLTPALPQLALIEQLTKLDKVPASSSTLGGEDADDREIPARKAVQINAFVAAVGQPRAPLVEWCAGKGHLGRRFMRRWGGAAMAVERNVELCATGQSIARQMSLHQQFVAADVMVPATAQTLRDGHAVALHACGDLHRRLIEAAVSVQAPAIDLAPCCYQLTADESYRPLSLHQLPALDRNELKLAVTETVTASPQELTNSERGSAWKLAFVALRERCSPGARYQPFRPVPAAWLREGFAGFLTRLADREKMVLPRTLDFPACEAEGWRRHGESRRLELVRLAFRRAIEVCLLCDLAAWLEQQGYRVSLREFCDRAVTPRNLLLSARLL